MRRRQTFYELPKEFLKAPPVRLRHTPTVFIPALVEDL